MSERGESWGKWGRASGATTLVAVAGLTFAAALDSLGVVGVGNPKTDIMLTLYGDSAIGVFATLIIAYAVWRLEPGLTRSTWLLLGAGVFAGAIGDGLWAAGEVTTGSPATLGISLSDLFYLGSYVLFAGALVRWVVAQRRSVDLAWITTESIVSAAVIGATVGVGLVGPTMRSMGAVSRTALLDAAWVAIDFPMIVAPTLLLVLALVRVRDEHAIGPWVPLCIGMALLVLADVGWFWERSHGSWAPGSLVDFAYMASNILIAIGALTALDIQTERKSGRRVGTAPNRRAS